MSLILKIIDCCCSAIWIAILFLHKIVCWCCIAVVFILFAVWTSIGEIRIFSKPYKKINDFFRKFYPHVKWFFILISNIYSFLLQKITKSIKLKRCFAVVLIVVLAFFIYPPSHWRPWYLYQVGTASYYGKGFHYKKTASGETFYPWSLTAASRTLPLGTAAKVVNVKNGRVVYVKINDRGPFVKSRILDLSQRAAEKLGMLKAGTATVKIYTHIEQK
ncbi:MAG TPA: septal ring lytic transglycosylase RlpA family protein [Victivallales bacterium]|nr:septal ring lytic transglycosylase RlpA family protein [Victivallales bacterium]